MKKLSILFASLFVIAGCGQQSEDTAEQPPADDGPVVQIETTKNGYGRVAETGDRVTVHYTGWLYDEAAVDNRGEQFDSSRDPGRTRYQFTIDESPVIQGWHDGVKGMLIGETRVLTIPPELAYGERGRGPIPGGATLIFEIDLYRAEGPADAASE
ncbi:MAG: FKBP-type peptidyl-prolyl cis-trans isomerase [Woeseiaceae bacterium]|nr:FKBP-type peptidyl-prolyl cis-trans isomerase [Woeseiaceae bacterium]